MPTDFPWEFVASLLSVLGLAYAAWLAFRGNRNTSRLDHQQRGYDQLQEDNETLRVERNAASARADRAEAQRRVMFDYAELLRKHIGDEIGPPPPAWPTEVPK